MAYDAADGYVVEVGPYQLPFTETTVVGTWTYAHGVWSNRTAPGGPQLTFGFGASLTYDAGMGAVLLVLANASLPTTEQTWEFRGGVWTELYPSVEPSARWYAAMAFDPALNETVLFGGVSLTQQVGGESWLSDTWVFSGGEWSEVSAGAPPSTDQQYGQVMAYDSATGRLVLVTNALTNSSVAGSLGGTFAFDGGGWQLLAGASNVDAPGTPEAMAYDPAIGGLVAFDFEYWFNQSSSVYVLSDGLWTTRFFEGFPSWTTAFAYDAADGYALMPSFEQSLNLTGPSMRPVTWVLANSTVGPPPTASLSATPNTVTLGGSVNFSGTYSGAYGATSIRLGVYAPGCPSAVNNRTVSCTPTAAGSYLASFEILDQAGRSSNVTVSFTVAPTVETQVLDVLPYGIAAAAVVAAVVVVLRWRPRRPGGGPKGGPRTGPGPGAP